MWDIPVVTKWRRTLSYIRSGKKSGKKFLTPEPPFSYGRSHIMVKKREITALLGTILTATLFFSSMNTNQAVSIQTGKIVKMS